MLKRKQLLLMATGALGAILLSGCGPSKDIKEEYEMIKSDKYILNYYEDDKLMPLVYEYKTDDELTKEVIDKMLGLQSSEDILPEYGVQKDQGIFIDFGMLNPGYIPTSTYSMLGSEREEEDRLESEERKQVVMGTMAKLLTATDSLSKSDSGTSDIDELKRQVEYRKEMMGKEKDVKDVNLFTYTVGIETKYKDELQGLRDAIRKSREIEKAKEALRIAQLENDSAVEAEKLNKQQAEMEEEHADLLKSIQEKETRFKSKLESDKEFSADEKSGKVDGLVGADNGKKSGKE